MNDQRSRNAARTQTCLASIRSHTDTRAKCVLVVGKTGAGKSSIIELVTGLKGLAGNSTNAGTTECQIASAQLDDTTYFMIDTPGFDGPDNEWEVASGIMAFIEEIRDHIDIVGICYLVSIWDLPPGHFEKKLCRWLEALCGQPFFTRLSFVTTFWGTDVGHSLESHNRRLRRCLNNDWGHFIRRGAGNEQFGKKYPFHIERDELLSWTGDRYMLALQARGMMTAFCEGSTVPEPLFLRELRSGKPWDQTTAAHVFRPTHPTASQASSRAPEINQPQQSDGEQAPASLEALFRDELGGFAFRAVVNYMLSILQEDDDNPPPDTFNPASLVDRLESENTPSAFASCALMWRLVLGKKVAFTGSEEQNSTLRGSFEEAFHT